MPKRIYIFEGPSGSGKTTFIKTLSNMGLVKIVTPSVELPRPRAYMDPDNGIRRSSLKDMIHFWTAFTDQGPLPLAIDRGFISQLVYSAIRNGEEEIPEVIGSLRSHLETLSMYLAYDLHFRGMAELPELPRIQYVFYLPLPSVIQSRRDHATNRTYAYSAQQEHFLYSETYWKINNLSCYYISDSESEQKFIKGELTDAV